jgi:hypothetical protein
MSATTDRCECVSCGDCGGSGRVWYSFPGPDRGGQYLGNNRCDDLDEMDTCPTCDGRGITDVCDHCQEADDDDMGRL